MILAQTFDFTLNQLRPGPPPPAVQSTATDLECVRELQLFQNNRASYLPVRSTQTGDAVANVLILHI